MDTLENFDVVLFNDQEFTKLNGQLMLVSKILKFGSIQIGRVYNPDTSLFSEDGVSCLVLQSSGDSGWRKGRIRFRLEFIPDQSSQEDESETQDCPENTKLLTTDDEFGNPGF